MQHGTTKPSILLVDDDPGIQFGYTRYLAKKGYTVDGARSLSEAQRAASAKRFDIVLLDLGLPDGNGIEWIGDLRALHPDLAIVVVTAHGDIPLAVQAVHSGADNFLAKPVDMDDLEAFPGRSLELTRMRRQQAARDGYGQREPSYFGESDVMVKVMEQASLAAQDSSPVLLEGLTGTGKGELARWIHRRSTQASEPFVEINCSGLRGDLLASEIFGHAKGAFTSAVDDKRGLVEVADGGTLFLDEVADMEPALQAQFLNVLEEKTFRRLGEVINRRSEFRLICSTNRELEQEVAGGRFRSDLFYRINVMPIRLPALKERLGDIPRLVKAILHDTGATDAHVSPEAMQMLLNHAWPGNIRELRNLLQRAVVLSNGGTLDIEHFPGLAGPLASGGSTRKGLTLAQLEGLHIHHVLDQYDGDTAKAAEALGISRAALYRRLRRERDEQ